MTDYNRPEFPKTCRHELKFNSCGSCGELGTEGSMEWTSIVALKNAAMGETPFHWDPCIPPSSVSVGEDGFHPAMATLWGAETGDSITSSPPLEQKPWMVSTSITVGSGFGPLNPDPAGTVTDAPVLDFFTYPLLLPLLDIDDRDRFWSYRNEHRASLMANPLYAGKRWLVHLSDVVFTLDLLFRYVCDKFEAFSVFTS